MGKNKRNKYVPTAMYKKKKYNCKRVYLLALFWRYGYWLVMILALMAFSNVLGFEIVLGLCVIGHGVYSLIISKIEARHFMVGMLGIEHRSMKDINWNYCKSQIKDWKREQHKVSIFFIIMGVVLIMLTLCHPAN